MTLGWSMGVCSAGAARGGSGLTNRGAVSLIGTVEWINQFNKVWSITGVGLWVEVELTKTYVGCWRRIKLGLRSVPGTLRKGGAE